MEHVKIIEATTTDMELLRTIGKQTFFETFSAENTEENMQKYLSENFSRAKLIAELKNPGSRFYLAVLASSPIGYLKLNWGQAQTELLDEDAMEIERIYVLKEFYGQRIGQALFHKALEIAKSKKISFLWLGVWEQNVRAINFYKKNGFVEFDKHLFILGDDAQTDIMMKLYI